jgi:hypothetical protein
VKLGPIVKRMGKAALNFASVPLWIPVGFALFS